MNILDYLGKPWQAGAVGPDAFDCWGLVRAVYWRELGVDLPSVEVDAYRALAVRRAFDMPVARDRWQALDRPHPFAAVLMSQASRPHHVGVWLPDNGGSVLHSVEGAGVVLHGRRSLLLAGWHWLGCYAWAG